MSISPASAAAARIAAKSRASRTRVEIDGISFASDASPAASMSVATTLAPSRANASALARPMPAAAAVTNARFPCSRPLIARLPSSAA
jgi:hypothetical protein